MAKGFLCLILHAHLPFVRHPEFDNFLEERWLYEAITETYIPLLNIFEELHKDNIDFKLVMSITPPLAHMLSDNLLQNRYIKHLNSLINLARKEVERTQLQPLFNKTAKMYLQKWEKCRDMYLNKYKKNIVMGFKKFQDMGNLEIVTSGATHGFLPLLNINKNVVNAQIAVAKQSHINFFDRPPKGMWNGECGYYKGLENTLEKHNIRFFFVDTHGILNASKRPKYGVYAPIYTPNGVAVFGRDVESSKSVWSASVGYPGDKNYREFYRDVGFDLSYDYIKDYILPNGIRVMTGLKYYKITGKDKKDKEPYDYDVAMKQAEYHSKDFMKNRISQIDYLSKIMDRQPIVVAPYDAELFGHWWYEGPHFIDCLIRNINKQNTIKLVTASEYLSMYPRNQVAQPSNSSWGDKGFGGVWLEQSNDWIYKHLHKAGDRMVELANKFYNNNDASIERYLNQCARELLLAQSSDWAFIMKTGTMVEYATKRVKDHISRFNELYTHIMEGKINHSYIETLEWKDNIFADIDFRVYSDKALEV